MAKDKLVIEMLPACEGDCLLLSYTRNHTRRHILVDGGRKATYRSLKQRLARLPTKERMLELLVVTHVDRDHIEGVIEMLEDRDCPVQFRDIWFNGYAHLEDPRSTREDFGGVLGERLTTYLAKHGPWNARFRRRAVYITGGPVRRRFDGGLEITVLSPDTKQLVALAKTWAKECAAANLDPMNPQADAPKKRPENSIEDFGFDVEKLAADAYEPDTAHANGSSIGLLVSFRDKKVLLGADCHPGRLLRSLRALKPPGRRIRLAAFKLPHHGSDRNISKEILDCIACSRYLISTNGAYFQHPARSAIARVLMYGGTSKQLYFNYRSPQTRIWDSAALMKAHGYTAHYPEKVTNNGTIVVAID